MKKTFDAVEMKREGQEALLKRLEGLTPQQQDAYWADRSRQLREEVERSRSQHKKSA